ncbi:MAG: hypothetical protein J0H66_08610 [Solirubrobacterales bacterium]|nr:hypothetical protein [Solirubrobacterales bacterium]OJU95856.1 MAG: hypothetical protein BGO23_09770 [Solirubrobacterales bacterium 67-14]
MHSHQVQPRRRARVEHPITKRLQAIPRDQRREVILDRIVLSLEEQGASEADWSLSQFARAANTSRVTLYEYFGDLESL